MSAIRDYSNTDLLDSLNGLGWVAVNANDSYYGYYLRLMQEYYKRGLDRPYKVNKEAKEWLK